MRRALPAALVLLPEAASAHDAFGDLGPFIAHLLHPLVDPAQGIVVVGAAVFLARQARGTVQSAYAAFAFAAVLGAALSYWGILEVPPLRTLAVAAVALGLLTGLGWRPPSLIAVLGLAATGFVAAAAVGLPDTGRAAILGAVGVAAGVAVVSLLAWSLFDWIGEKFGHVPTAVVGSWIAAIGLMLAALPP